jgi:putative peptidoglycan lipid II flippase
MSDTIRSSILASALSAVLIALSLLNQIIIARSFGAGSAVDAYMLAISLPALVMGTVSGVFSYAMVPVLISQARRSENHKGFRSALFICIVGCSILIAMLPQVFVRSVANAMMPARLRSMYDTIIVVARLSWFTAGLSVTANFFSAVHYAERRFILPIIGSAAPYAGMIVVTVAGARLLGVAALAWGMLAGYVVCVLLLLRGAAAECAGGRRTRAAWKDAFVHMARMPLVLLSLLCFTVYTLTDAFWSYSLHAGDLSYLGYCQRIVTAVGAVISAGPSAVILPILSARAAQGQWDVFEANAGLAIRAVLAWAAPAALMISVARVPLIRLTLQRGAFSTESTAGLASVLPAMLTGMVAMAAVVMAFKALYARGDQTGTVVLGVCGAASYFLLSGVLSRHAGVQGIAVAYAVSWWLLLLAAACRTLRLRLTQFASPENRTFALHCGAALICAWLTGTTVAAVPNVSHNPAFSDCFRSALSTAACGSVYLFMGTRFFRLREITLVLDRLSTTRILWLDRMLILATGHRQLS